MNGNSWPDDRHYRAFEMPKIGLEADPGKGRLRTL